MYSGVAQIISDKMGEHGFSAKPLGMGVTVWLNREITTMEVETVLEENFQGKYLVSKIAKNQVMIEEDHKIEDYRGN